MKKLIKKIVFFILCFSTCSGISAQIPDYSQKLYYTCKIWGFVRFNHSEVSTCKVNWDSILIAKLPLIKAAGSSDEFNDIMFSMLNAAGHTAKATYPLPDTLPENLKINRNFSWFNDALIREDVRAILDTIKINFRPMDNCFVKYNDGTCPGGWLMFPNDYPIYNQNLSTAFPDENHILNIVFRYWNLLAYLNPNNDILDVPWDSTLYYNIINIASCKNSKEFLLNFRKFTASLNDAHVEGLTTSMFDTYLPKLLIKRLKDNYAVLKSGYTEIAPGDIITGIDGKTIKQIEDSLSRYVSSGNPNVYGRFLKTYILKGKFGSEIQLEYEDSVGFKRTLKTYRYTPDYNPWFSISFHPDLDSIKWKVFGCNVAYVNLANLLVDDLNKMYPEVKNCSSIIFDIRNYPYGVMWNLANLMYPGNRQIAYFKMPDLTYPGTFFNSKVWLGYDNNQNYYKGKVIIIINEMTQSHAEYTCMMFRAMPDCIVVGSQTAGADGDVSWIYISNDLKTGYTSLTPYYPDGRQTQRIGIVPDSVIYLSPQGIRQRQDEVLDKAFEIAGCPYYGIKEEQSNFDFGIIPNPLSQNTKLNLFLEQDALVKINLYNVFGNNIIEVYNDYLSKGKHIVDMDLNDINSGIYYCSVTYNNKTLTKKLVVIK